MPAQQARYWILTVPHYAFTPYLPEDVCYTRGQLELPEAGYLHWQFLAYFKKPVTLHRLKQTYGEAAHAEKTRSAAAETYVFKDDTKVAGTEFELGRRPFRPDSKTDWEQIWELAKAGNLAEIPVGVRVRSYSTLRRIEKDHIQAVGIEKNVKCFYGSTGTGKSRKAWEEGGLDAFPKDPLTKFWDGYQGQENVIIEEFRGSINISHILRWLDRYPVVVEVKGGAVVLKAKNVWITSNLHPDMWYPDLDDETKKALKRRMAVTHFVAPLM